MNISYRLIVVLSAVAMVGCSSYSSNMMVGRDVSYVSLAEQRAAATGVQVLAQAPQGGKSLGLVEAGRCHRMFTETPPDDQLVLLDLKVGAYARGADAIASVSIEEVSALTKNCWYMLVGKASAFQLPPKSADSQGK